MYLKSFLLQFTDLKVSFWTKAQKFFPKTRLNIKTLETQIEDSTVFTLKVHLIENLFSLTTFPFLTSKEFSTKHQVSFPFLHTNFSDSRAFFFDCIAEKFLSSREFQITINSINQVFLSLLLCLLFPSFHSLFTICTRKNRQWYFNLRQPRKKSNISVFSSMKRNVKRHLNVFSIINSLPNSQRENLKLLLCRSCVCYWNV